MLPGYHAPVTGLAIVIFAVEDLSRAVAFYEAAFACREAVSTPNYVELDIGGQVRLGLYAHVGFGRNIGHTTLPLAAGSVSRTELYFRVGSLPAAIARLEAAGARLLSSVQARPWGETAAYYADPDGNVLAVAAPG
jgi:catechol 2,3-dioxygenase-like lactoylglutathione lyase family enzyme